jgi:hypothetical protein
MFFFLHPTHDVLLAVSNRIKLLFMLAVIVMRNPIISMSGKQASKQARRQCLGCMWLIRRISPLVCDLTKPAITLALQNQRHRLQVAAGA